MQNVFGGKAMGGQTSRAIEVYIGVREWTFLRKLTNTVTSSVQGHVYRGPEKERRIRENEGCGDHILNII
jgi:hypothetical protein